jgi:hypothetical protein
MENVQNGLPLWYRGGHIAWVGLPIDKGHDILTKGWVCRVAGRPSD